MYRLHGFIDKPGLDGGAFTVDRVDETGLLDYIRESCDGGSILISSVERLTAGLAPPGFRNAYTWHLHPDGGETTSDDVGYDTPAQAGQALRAHVASSESNEGTPDMWDTLVGELLELPAGDPVDFDLDGGGWIALLRLRVRA